MRFDGPVTDQIPNSGVIGGDITVTTSSPSGFPAKYRGLYFDGSNTAYIPLSSFTLYHTCSFHFWLIPISDGVVFSKDRPTYDGSSSQRHLRLRLKHDLPQFRMRSDDDSDTSWPESSASSTFTNNVWLYLVVSVELDSN